ncbi:hypothetical protein BJ546DRAFT_158192 [Cryomyces antarcticus]
MLPGARSAVNLSFSCSVVLLRLQRGRYLGSEACCVETLSHGSFWRALCLARNQSKLGVLLHSGPSRNVQKLDQSPRTCRRHKSLEKRGTSGIMMIQSDLTSPMALIPYRTRRPNCTQVATKRYNRQLSLSEPVINAKFRCSALPICLMNL